ncbi:MAG: EAL domain-containing protein, partial [Pyrinomonadaceae bacterium]|nr:EAL domain-containing protein [Pyrinomonadaceae bacterium]
EMAQPFNLCGYEVFSSASIGIALSTEGYTRAEDILRDADTAMYRAKALGKARHEMFDREMHTQANEALTLETDLRRAVERQEFVVHYQPIVELATGRISGFEALVRWQHPKHGLLSPAKFIPMAEETGLIVPIGEWILGESCRQMRLWQEQFPTYPPLTISVNLSGKQFAQAGSVKHIKQVLHETNLDPRSLKLEIRESAVMENIETAAGMLKQLRALGVKLSMDDFGTGYSSLSYLNRFPISTLNIDRSFIKEMADQDENAAIVRTIIMLAQTLEMDVVAEGIETEDQVTQLQALGCEFGQGYFFSEPISRENATRFLSDTGRCVLNLPIYDDFEPLQFVTTVQ